MGGIDVGKAHHWICVVDVDEAVQLSVKVANDESEITAVIGEVADFARQIVWAVDIVGTPSALVLALLAQAGHCVRYASGRVVSAMSAAFAGEGKTDARDARVIAETARIRRDLPAVDQATELVRELDMLTAHRADLVADRVWMINGSASSPRTGRTW